MGHRGYAVCVASVLSLACSSTPTTLTSVPRVWPVPAHGALALVSLDEGVVVVEEDTRQGSLPVQISRVDAAGGLPTLLSIWQPSFRGTPVVVESELLWTSGQPARLRATPLAGGVAPRTITTHDGWINGLAADATHVYFGWTARVSGDTWSSGIARVLRSGGVSEDVAPCSAQCTVIAVVDGTLYVHDDDDVRALSIAGDATRDVALGVRPRRVLRAGDDLYVLTRPSSDGAADAALVVVPCAGGAVRTVVSGIRDPVTTGGRVADLAVGARHVVLLDALHQPSPELVIVGRDDGHVEHRALRGQPRHVALDASWIYVAGLEGDVIDRERLAP